MDAVVLTRDRWQRLPISLVRSIQGWRASYMPWQLVVFASFLMITPAVTSAVEAEANPEPYLDKEFVIVRSTSSFKDARQAAANAATELSVRLDLRGLSPHERTGLTFSKEECTRSEFPYPCYVPRGRWDDGTYVSVEWSSAYKPFSKKLYVVMIASDVPGSRETRRMLEAARRVYPDACAKRVKVYVGCMH
jgi:hypothetical protein